MIEKLTKSYELRNLHSNANLRCIQQKAFYREALFLFIFNLMCFDIDTEGKLRARRRRGEDWKLHLKYPQLIIKPRRRRLCVGEHLPTASFIFAHIPSPTTPLSLLPPTEKNLQLISLSSPATTHETATHLSSSYALLCRSVLRHVNYPELGVCKYLFNDTPLSVTSDEEAEEVEEDENRSRTLPEYKYIPCIVTFHSMEMCKFN